ncbi:hypothetical protein RIF29_20828 [Crotalaria pallida]|uniref:GTD-binding domain-containing protein n=1 Tax=Crotalaria pallida TaxID=3830 RepID=A0AAN9F5F5_CROPI
MTRNQGGVIAMKETLHAQQRLLHKLYSELEKEREASATAASEAMKMIVHLQGEKALVKMEANQYKRMAEEKIGHAEASLEAFVGVMYKKEMEIASLEFQVQAYKHKLLSLGCDLSGSELNSSIRRMHSLPPLQFNSSFRVVGKRESSPSPVLDVITNIVEESTDKEVSSPSLDSTNKSVEFDCGTSDIFWNQIKMLDDKVKLISGCTEEKEKGENLSSRRGWSCSILPQATNNITCDQTERLPYINSDTINHDEDTQDSKVANPPCSPNVYDVFEVPQTHEKRKVIEHEIKRLDVWNSEAENMFAKPDSVFEGMVESCVKHDAGKQKGMLRIQNEISIPNPKDVMTIIDPKKDGMYADCNVEAKFQKMHLRIKRLEKERISTRQENFHEGHGEEQLSMLKDIQSQLTLMQSNMTSSKTKKATLKDDVLLGLLQERDYVVYRKAE